MKTEEQKYDYLKFKRKCFEIGHFLDIPILIILWYLDYRLAFTIVLVLMILDTFAFVRGQCKRIKELDLN